MLDWENKYKMKEVEIMIDDNKEIECGVATGLLITAVVWIVAALIWSFAA